MMSTTKITMLSLPLEIVQQIADEVEIVHRPSLFAFSLASKACRKVASFLIFQKISIRIQDRDGLQRDANRLAETLFHTDSARHVQSITIKGALRLKARRTDLYNPECSWVRKSGLAEILDDEELVDSSGLFIVYDEGVIKESSEEDMAWAPFVNLLEATTRLKDLIYDCQSQLPPSLLRALHKQHLLCRLHHLTFRFRTLLWGVPYPYEMELATSPSLYRLKVLCTDQDSEGDFDYNMDAIMELAAGLAPNLKEVSISQMQSYLEPRRRSVRRPLWQGLPGYSRERIGSLTSLSLSGASYAALQKWTKHTDFNKLQRLTVRDSPLFGAAMRWIARNNSIQNLKTLFVNLSRHGNYNGPARYLEQARSFFPSIDSLEELTMTGPMEPQMIEAILIQHGPTLKKLSLRPSESSARRETPMVFTEERILQIRDLCPVLETLTLTVKRDKSSASETALYKSFAKMQSLQSLFLILDCANWRSGRDPTYSDARFKGEDGEVIWAHSDTTVKRGDIKEALINSAVDAGLARSIWDVITNNKTGKRLERLKLWTQNGGVVTRVEANPSIDPFAQSMSRSWLVERSPREANPSIDAFAQSMGRSWLVERSPREDAEEVSVKELRQCAREAYERESLKHMDPVVLEIFHSIWPRKQESGDWRDDWAGFPLQG